MPFLLVAASAERQPDPRQCVGRVARPIVGDRDRHLLSVIARTDPYFRFGEIHGIFKDIAEAIIEPSKVISDQYDSKFLNLKNGDVIIGRIMQEDKKFYMVSSNPFLPDLLDKIAKNRVASIKSSPVSLMPPALINSLNKDELLDLLAYLTSGGNPTAPAFK